jgi:hypothetical protein
LSALDPGLTDELSARSQLASAWRRLEQALEEFIHGNLIAA